MKLLWNQKMAFKSFEKLNILEVTPPIGIVKQKIGLKVADLRNKVKRLFEFCKENLLQFQALGIV